MTRILIGAMIGAAIGGGLGYFGSCVDGACPITGSWQRGAMMLGIVGAIAATSSMDAFFGSSRKGDTPDQSSPEP